MCAHNALNICFLLQYRHPDNLQVNDKAFNLKLTLVKIQLKLPQVHMPPGLVQIDRKHAVTAVWVVSFTTEMRTCDLGAKALMKFVICKY